MKRFKDITIRLKLLIAFGFILLSIVLLSLLFWSQTDRITQRAENLYNHPLTVRQAMNEFEVSVLAMRVEYRNLLLSDIYEEQLKAEHNYILAKEKARLQFDVLYDNYLGPRNDIDALKNHFDRLIFLKSKQITEIKKRTDGKIIPNAQKLQDDINDVRQLLMFSIDKIDDFAINKADLLYKESVALNMTLKRHNISYAIIIFIVVFIILFIFRRDINSPLRELRYVASMLGKGKMEVRSSNDSKDEFGVLAAAFNTMASSLEKESLLKDMVAKLSDVMLQSDDLKSFCEITIKQLLEDTHAQMGAVYLLDETENNFDVFYSQGVDVSAFKSFSVLHPQGEFALALASEKVSHITDLSDNVSFNFNTTAGVVVPKAIITIPIFSMGNPVALFSLVSLYNYSEISLCLVDNIFDSLTARFNSVLLYKTVTDFNHRLEIKNEKLDAQKCELTQMTDELVEQNKELEQQKYQLGEMNRLKTDFLSSMSHELRTPLNSVIALSGVLNRRLAGKIPEQEHGYIDVIERNGNYLLSLINDILDLSRIESGKVEIELIRFEIQTLIDQVLGMVQPQADLKNVAVSYTSDEDGIFVISDYNKALHIVQNLIGNAVKFTEKGNISIHARVKDAVLYLSVKDTGIGIGAADLSYIFDEFRQADSSNSRRFGGTGLGLSIAMKYALLLGGNIEVESVLDQGSEFTFKLPLAPPDLESSNVADCYSRSESLSLSVDQDNSSKTILLVEDTEAMVVQITDILNEQNYKLIVANSGEQALLELQSKHPDVMILDLMMPGMDGLEVLQRVRNQKKYELLPIIILTAKILSEEELSFLKKCNVCKILQKGAISKHDFLHNVHTLLNTDNSH